MIYQWHDMFRMFLQMQFNAAAAMLGTSALAMKAVQNHPAMPEACKKMAADMSASAEMMRRFAKDYPRPQFNIPGATPEIAASKPWCDLKHFRRDTNRNDPKILIVAPMSGHYATLLSGTVEALLPDHDVYITDWKDAREVPLKDGEFGLEDYISYVQEFIRKLGPETHVVAVCQPTVPVLAAIADMAAANDACQPQSMTLMGGPIDVAAAPTAVTKFADGKPLDWFARNVIAKVPPWYAGAGRMVYPGFLQITGFMSMNPEKHFNSHMDMFNHLRQGDGESADKIKAFYDEYLAVCDLSGRFYLDTIDQVFLRRTLAKGEMKFQGRLIDPSKITKTALFTVEGELDDIAAPGQTIAAHKLCMGIKPEKHYNYMQNNAGHYGIFNGRRWREEICPRLAYFIRETAASNGFTYDASQQKIIPTEKFDPGHPKAAGHIPRPR